MSSNSFETRKMFAEKIVNLSGLKGTELSDEYIRLVNLPVEELSKTLTKLEVDAAMKASQQQHRVQEVQANRDRAWKHIVTVEYQGRKLSHVEANRTVVMGHLISEADSGRTISNVKEWFLSLAPHLAHLAWVEARDISREAFLKHVRGNGLSESEANWQAWRDGHAVTLPETEDEATNRRPYDFPGTPQYSAFLRRALPSELAALARKEREAARAAGPVQQTLQQESIRGVETRNGDDITVPVYGVVETPQATLDAANAKQRDSFKAASGRVFQRLGPEITFDAIKRMDRDALRILVRTHGEEQINNRIRGIS